MNNEENIMTVETTAPAEVPKKKRRVAPVICIVLIVLFTLILGADIANYFTFRSATVTMGDLASMMDSSSAFSFGDSDVTLPDGADASDSVAMPDSFSAEGFSADGTASAGDSIEMPGGDAMGSRGSMGAMGDMATSADGADADAMTLPDSTDMTDMTGMGDVTLPDATDTTDLVSEQSTTTGMLYRVRSAMRTAWLPIAIVCALGDLVCIIFLLRIRKKTAVEAAANADAEDELADEIPAKAKRPLWIIPVALLLVAAVALWALPRLNSSFSASITVVTETLSATAETGSIDDILVGTGTLSGEDATEITVPDTVSIEAYYVSNGDTVSEGDLIATVDKISVASAIVELQETLDQLDEALAEAAEEEVSANLSSTAGGRVKVIYAKEDVSVADTVAEYGCLMLISLDGLMAVDIDAGDAMSVGDSVIVTLSDETEMTGRIAQLLNGVATVTVSDDGSEYCDEVTVTDEDGNTLGSGALYIHSELKVISYYGIVSAIKVDENESIDAGETLLKLTDVGNSATYTSLLAQRQELADQMATLYQLYISGDIYASCSGVVSGISDDANIITDDTAQDADSETKSDSAVVTGTAAATSSSFTLKLLTTTSTAQNEAGGTDDVVPVAEANAQEDPADDNASGNNENADADTAADDASSDSDDNSDVNANDNIAENSYTTDSVTFPDEADEADAQMPGTENTLSPVAIIQGATVDLQSELVYNTNVFKYVYVDTASSDLDANTVGEYTVTCYAIIVDTSGISLQQLTLSVQVISAEDQAVWQQENPTGTVLDGTSSDNDQQQQFEVSDETDTLTQSDDSFSTEQNASLSDEQSAVTTVTTIVDTGADSTAASASISYTIAEQTVLSITPQDTMTISISVDELDILSLSEGQSAEITLDALTGRSFTGAVTSIATTGTNSGGNTKFSVEITMARTEQMLNGMNASVKITLSTTENVLIIPEAALVEDGNTTYVYTSYDEASDTLGDPISVETGVSDGENVEIRSGLLEGDTVYYSYSDTLTYSITTGFASLFG